MAECSFTRSERIWLRDHSTFTERWVQSRIAEDPSILGLGDLVLKDKERRQQRAGRLDLLLQDADAIHRYEVEIQLGPTDESHIIRTIEYWDNEKKLYPQYEHCAVIVAEEITARFLNVINLFNGHVPLIALQMTALKVGENHTLVFTTVMDQLKRGLVDDDEETAEVTDRAYWEARATRDTVGLADQVLSLIHVIDPSLELKYNKFYIGLARKGEPSNFVIFRAKKKFIKVEIRHPETPDLTDELEQAGVDLMEYDRRWSRYRIRLTQDELNKHRELLSKILAKAHANSKE